MKRALEALLVVAVLLAAATIVFHWRARQSAVERMRRESGPATHPGIDVDPARPWASPHLLPSERGVDSMPMIKMSSPPKPVRRKTLPPPPPR